MTKRVQMRWRLSQDLTGNEMRVYQYLREGKKESAYPRISSSENWA